MIVIGLTGSIGMGKTTLGRMMTSMGIAVHDSDQVVEELLWTESEARPAIASYFPYFEYPQIYEKKTYEINKQELGALIFKHDDLRIKLEGILHPYVRKSQSEFIRHSIHKGLDMVCLDIPLLFETGADDRVDYTIVVSAPEFLQRQRVLSRPDMSEEKFEAILNRQMPDQEKCRRADFVIQTGLGRAHAMQSLKKILVELRNEHLEQNISDSETERQNEWV